MIKFLLYYFKKDFYEFSPSKYEYYISEPKIEIAKNLVDVLDDETISIKIGLDIKTIENLKGAYTKT